MDIHEDLLDSLAIADAMREIEAGTVKLLTPAEALVSFAIDDEDSPRHWPELQHYH